MECVVDATETNYMTVRESFLPISNCARIVNRYGLGVWQLGLVLRWVQLDRMSWHVAHVRYLLLSWGLQKYVRRTLWSWISHIKLPNNRLMKIRRMLSKHGKYFDNGIYLGF